MKQWFLNLGLENGPPLMKERKEDQAGMLNVCVTVGYLMISLYTILYVENLHNVDLVVV